MTLFAFQNACNGVIDLGRIFFDTHFCLYPFLSIKLQGGISLHELLEQVQGVGLMGWVKTRPMVYDSPSVRSTSAREALALLDFLVEPRNKN